MDVLRQAFLYAILAATFYGGILGLRMLSRVQVPLGYSDVRDLGEFTSYRVDQTVAFSAWRAGDAACWRLGPDEAQAVNFGWVAALPGDLVRVRGGILEVNGQLFERGDDIRLPDCGPVRIPDQHLFVVTHRHQGDSLAYGPLPASALRGRLESLP